MENKINDLSAKMKFVELATEKLPIVRSVKVCLLLW